MYRMGDLIQLDQKLFHTNDLAILWSIANKNTLYTTIKRYVQKGILFSVYKGLYSSIPITALNPLKLGQAVVHRYAYLSMESILSQTGVISQTIYDITYITNVSKSVAVNTRTFRYRKLKDKFLYNPAGIIEQNGVFTAGLERAVADILYFNPKYHFDIPEKIDFAKVKSIQKEVGYI